jgi:hypothetical protein
VSYLYGLSTYFACCVLLEVMLMSSESLMPSLSSSDDPRTIQVIAVGSLDVVNSYVMTQYRLGVAEVSEWSRPLPVPASMPTTVPTSKKVMRILTKRFGSQRRTSGR